MMYPILVATDRGLEPLLTESESAVLPLHQSALLSANKYYYNKLLTEIKCFFHFLRNSYCFLAGNLVSYYLEDTQTNQLL